MDVSGYQSPVTVSNHAATDQFVICKATEGKGKDIASYPQYIEIVRASPAKPAAYHYGWPENGWRLDFDHFVRYARLRVGEAGCLDFEPWASRQPLADPATFPGYVIGWCDAFREYFGVDPLLYIPDYFVTKIQAVATPDEWARIATLPFFKAGKNGVYVKDPSVGFGDNLGFATVAAWQWTDEPLDQDLLYVPWSTIAITKGGVTA